MILSLGKRPLDGESVGIGPVDKLGAVEHVMVLDLVSRDVPALDPAKHFTFRYVEEAGSLFYVYLHFEFRF